MSCNTWSKSKVKLSIPNMVRSENIVLSTSYMYNMRACCFDEVPSICKKQLKKNV